MPSNYLNTNIPGVPYTTQQVSQPTSASASRLQSLGLPSKFMGASPNITVSGTSLSGSQFNDRRVRISMLPNSPNIYYRDTTNILMNALNTTNGVLFPFQPKIDLGVTASYSPQKVVQSNFVFQTYENSEIKSFTLSSDFPVTNQLEGEYYLAATTFLRCLCFSFTGNDGDFAGSPPLVVSVSGMGFGGLDYIPVAITDVTISYPDNVDYVSIAVPGIGGEVASVPIISTISVNCLPMFSREFASHFSTLQFGIGQTRLRGPNSTLGSKQ